MHRVIDVLVDGVWLTQPPSFKGQKVRETIYLQDGSFGTVEYTFKGDGAPDMRITKLAFKQRFTQAERIAIRTASLTIPVVYDFEDLVDSATFIDLSRQDTIIAVEAIEQIIPLDTGRAIEILTAPILEHERFKG